MRFDLDTQRAVACVAGLIFLTGAMVASAFGHPPPDSLIGVFGTMVMGPILDATIQRYREAKRMQKEASEEKPPE